jgi:hypothetical protein
VKRLFPHREIVKRANNQPNLEVDAMLFEHTLSLFLGDEAARTAGQANHPTHRRTWLRKVCRLIRKRIETLNTTPRLKESLLSTVEYASDEIRADHQPTWRLVFRLLALTGKLLGYRHHKGALLDLVPYWRNEAQSLTEKMLRGGRRPRRDDGNKGARVVRRQIVRLLKRQGVSDGTIAEALRISKYEVQQLRRGQW